LAVELYIDQSYSVSVCGGARDEHSEDNVYTHTYIHTYIPGGPKK